MSEQVRKMCAEMGFRNINEFGDMRLDDIHLNARELDTPLDLVLFLVNWGRDDGRDRLQKQIKEALNIPK